MSCIDIFHYDYCFNNRIIYIVMTEELVTLETAKLLKAAGFKEDVSSFYELVYKGGSGPEYEIDESYDAQNYNTDVHSISLLQLNPLPKSGCVKSRSCISLYIIVLPATHTIYLKRIWERYFIVSPKVRMMEVIGAPTRKH